MKLTNNHIGKLIQVIQGTTPSSMIMFDYDGQPHAIISGPNWIDYIDPEQFPEDYSENISFLPEGLVGLLVELAEPYPKVTINYAKVLFPESKYKDPDNMYLAFPQETKNVAGAYWISGDFVEILETDT